MLNKCAFDAKIFCSTDLIFNYGYFILIFKVVEYVCLFLISFEEIFLCSRWKKDFHSFVSILKRGNVWLQKECEKILLTYNKSILY